MSRLTPGILALNSGELSPSMEGRTDVKQYATGCFALENFIPMIQGPVRRRPGTRYCSEVKSSAVKSALTEFSRSTFASFMLEWGDHYLRFYNNHALVTYLAPAWNAVLGGVTIDGPLAWANRGFPMWASQVYGSEAVIIDSNGNLQIVTAGGGGASGAQAPVWSIAAAGTTSDGALTWTNLGIPTWGAGVTYAPYSAVYSPVGIQQIGAVGDVSAPGTTITAYEIRTPYAAADLFDASGFLQLVFIESADVVYFTHRSTTFPVMKLSHLGTANWTLQVTNFIGGPFASENPGSSPIMYASAQTGSGITLYASSDVLPQSVMGALVQLTQQNIREIRPWEPGKMPTKGNRRRYNGVTYEALNGDGATITSGSVPPTHLTGTAYDGGGGGGILWEYRDPGYGYVQLISRAAAPAGSSATIIGITAAKPPIVTVSGALPTGLADGSLVFITGVIGMPEVNDKFYRVKAGSIFGLTFALQQDSASGAGAPADVDGANWDAYVSGGTADNRIYSYVVNVPQQAQGGEINRLPATVVGSENATSLWAVGAWNNRDGYPSATAFFRGRLGFARAGRVDYSVAQDFENFSALTPNALVTADQAISVVLPTQDPIEWLVEGRIMVAGTASTEHGISEINPSAALAQANIATRPELHHGSRAVRPQIVGHSLLWAQTSGMKLRSMKYNFYLDNYDSDDLTATNDTITLTGIIASAFQQEPDSVLWLLRADGLLIGLTFNEEQQVIAWHRHPMIGQVESIACIPAPDGSQDELWMIVNRTIAGVTRRYVEYLAPHFLTGDDLVTDSLYSDSGVTYSGAPTLAVAGLSYLNGQTVKVLTDGSVHPDCVVANGQIVLQRKASVVQVGLPQTAKLTLMPLEIPGPSGTSQGKMKRITNTQLRFLNALGGQLGNDNRQLFNDCLFRDPQDQMDKPVPVFSGLFPSDSYAFSWPDGYDQEAKMTYRNSDPYPATICAVYPDVTSAD